MILEFDTIGQVTFGKLRRVAQLSDFSVSGELNQKLAS